MESLTLYLTDERSGSENLDSLLVMTDSDITTWRHELANYHNQRSASLLNLGPQRSRNRESAAKRGLPFRSFRPSRPPLAPATRASTPLQAATASSYLPECCNPSHTGWLEASSGERLPVPDSGVHLVALAAVFNAPSPASGSSPGSGGGADASSRRSSDSATHSSVNPTAFALASMDSSPSAPHADTPAGNLPVVVPLMPPQMRPQGLPQVQVQVLVQLQSCGQVCPASASPPPPPPVVLDAVAAAAGTAGLAVPPPPPPPPPHMHISTLDSRPPYVSSLLSQPVPLAASGLAAAPPVTALSPLARELGLHISGQQPAAVVRNIGVRLWWYIHGGAAAAAAATPLYKAWPDVPDGSDDHAFFAENLVHGKRTNACGINSGRIPVELPAHYQVPAAEGPATATAVYVISRSTDRCCCDRTHSQSCKDAGHQRWKAMEYQLAYKTPPAGILIELKRSFNAGKKADGEQATMELYVPTEPIAVLWHLRPPNPRGQVGRRDAGDGVGGGFGSSAAAVGGAGANCRGGGGVRKRARAAVDASGEGGGAAAADDRARPSHLQPYGSF